MSLSDERTSLTSDGARKAYDNVDTVASRLVIFLLNNDMLCGLLGMACLHFIFF